MTFLKLLTPVKMPEMKKLVSNFLKFFLTRS